MATTAESRVIYLAGVAQGIALVTFPAVSTVLTNPDEYDLSNTQYGALFLPQVTAAIAAALLGSSLAGRFGTKRVYLAGLAASLLAMVLLLASAPVAGDAVAYPLLLVATASLGTGFGRRNDVHPKGAMKTASRRILIRRDGRRASPGFAPGTPA